MNALPVPPDGLASGDVELRFVRIIPGDAIRSLVPSYHFRILSQGVDVGHINFRIGDTSHIQLAAGHIGFEVQQPFRGHGYACQAAWALAPFVRRFQPSVIITCDPDNIASIRTIERLGATFRDEVAVPADDPHYLRGSRIKRRYDWRP